MKIETSKLVCDRCGVEVKEQHSRFEHITTQTRRFMNICETSEKPETYRADEEIKKVNDEFLVYDIVLHTSFKKENKQYDLCKKCRKDFMKFMYELNINKQE